MAPLCCCACKINENAVITICIRLWHFSIHTCTCFIVSSAEKRRGDWKEKQVDKNTQFLFQLSYIP